VNNAIKEVIGPIEGPLLRSLVSWDKSPSGMPTSQSMLLWVKQTKPGYFRDVLEKAKQYDHPSHLGAKS